MEEDNYSQQELFEQRKYISDLINLFENDNYEEARLLLQKIISGYKPRSKIVDFNYK